MKAQPLPFHGLLSLYFLMINLRLVNKTKYSLQDVSNSMSNAVIFGFMLGKVKGKLLNLT